MPHWPHRLGVAVVSCEQLDPCGGGRARPVYDLKNDIDPFAISPR